MNLTKKIDKEKLKSSVITVTSIWTGDGKTMMTAKMRIWQSKDVYTYTYDPKKSLVYIKHKNYQRDYLEGKRVPGWGVASTGRTTSTTLTSALEDINYFIKNPVSQRNGQKYEFVVSCKPNAKKKEQSKTTQKRKSVKTLFKSIKRRK